ncbi:hypothetical protein BC833DRAFT_653335 [Globomyces pollinis-pini]|nr:hypothetical protein BC833DRAFT_653335 [Globomyces pollinis-pini]
MTSKSSDKKLYIGRLDARVSVQLLSQLFAQVGPIQDIKIIHQHKNKIVKPDAIALNFAFVEYTNRNDAQMALESMNGYRIFDSDIKVNWACHSYNADLATHYHIFIGDLSLSVTDQILTDTFSRFPSLSEARVMKDPITGKSRGYGFAAFSSKEDAQAAIEEFDKFVLGSRAIRCNWATQKSTNEKKGFTGNKFRQGQYYAQGQQKPINYSQQQTYYQQPEDLDAAHLAYPMYNQNHIQMQYPYQQPVQNTQTNRTVYIGNISSVTTESQIEELFEPYGKPIEIKLQLDKGIAFIKMEAHEYASNAINGINQAILNGRQLKCSWGKEKPYYTDNSYTYGYGVYPVPYDYHAYYPPNYDPNMMGHMNHHYPTQPHLEGHPIYHDPNYEYTENGAEQEPYIIHSEENYQHGTEYIGDQNNNENTQIHYHPESLTTNE